MSRGFLKNSQIGNKNPSLQIRTRAGFIRFCPITPPFLTDTCECIIDYYEADFDFDYILVSESYNVFFRQRIFDRNIIIGVNFGLQ